MIVRIEKEIAQINQQQWNQLVRDNHPFLRYEFLLALEQHRCVGETFGWLPCHVTVYEGEQLVGAMPLYLKTNSYGEFVFDQSWADAWQRNGLKYYPKLVSAIPYTPATGERLLVKKGYEQQVYPRLLEGAQNAVENYDASSLHLLFPVGKQQQWLQSQGFYTRHDCQYHWYNQDYQNFDDFLANLNSRKRKKIKQERRYVQEAGISLRVLDGHCATEDDWDRFCCFYHETFNQKWGIATLNGDFFKSVAKAMPDQVVLVMADHNDRSIAGALMYRSNTTLYGRHWGSIEHFNALHFEACYYQGIEYCIKHGLNRFEPGAQGEHKIARGFIPTLTRSCHWIKEPRFKAAIEQFTHDEYQAIQDYMDELDQHLPYKKSG